jgi:hypothetical protein
MSNSNVFTNNLAQTSLNDAYKFNTFSEFIQKQATAHFSPTCIFCSSNNTLSLTNDGGSFKQCNTCKKQFKALLM